MSVQYLGSIAIYAPFVRHKVMDYVEIVRRSDRGLTCNINYTFTNHDVLPWNGYGSVPTPTVGSLSMLAESRGCPQL